MRAGLALIGALALGACASLREPSWKVYADCSAAYEANARIADPERSTEMRDSIGDTAIDYQVAAVPLYRHQVGGDSEYAVNGTVAYIKSRTPAFAAKSRKDLDAYIERCPQV